MQAISFGELIAATGGEPVGGLDSDGRFQRIQTDSRQVAPGDLFWALQGDRLDGHQFAAQALERGALAVVAEARRREIIPSGPAVLVEGTLPALWRFAHWYRKRFDTLVIGVTGSVAKTTTRRMIHSVLSARFAGMESPRNYNNRFGVPLSLLELEPEHEYAVIELGASGIGEIAQLCTIAQPEIGVVTILGPAHLDGFETFENIIHAKAELIEALPASGVAVLNGDDRNIRRMAERTSARVIFVGQQPHNDVVVQQIAAANTRLRFVVDDVVFEVPVVGRHHLPAALLAYAIGRDVGLTPSEIARGFANYQAVPGRSQPLTIGPWMVIDDTYNANPVSMSAACQTLREWETPGKRVLVTGDMLALGTWSEDFHRILGEEIVRNRIDHLIALGSQAATLARSAKQSGMDAGCLGVCRDQQTALMLLDCWLDPGDVVLVKGSRDMHMETIVEGLRQLAAQYSATETIQRKVA